MRGTKRERILRVLLNHGHERMTKYRVSKEADVSIGWTMEFLKKLDKMGLIKKMSIKDTEDIFEYWVSISRNPRSYDFFVNKSDALLKKTNMKYALTTYKAENLVNHFLFPSRTDLYIRSDDLRDWKRLITEEHKGFFGKGNLRLLVYDEHVFYNMKKRKGLWTVSIPQIMHDLKKEGGVCGEAYDMMVMKFVR